MRIQDGVKSIFFLGLFVAALAQQPSLTVPPLDRPQYWSAAKLKAFSAALKAKEPMVVYGKTMMQAAEVLGGREDLYCFLERREDEPHWPEVHANWDDIVIVQEGGANLLSGGIVEGGQDQGKGETRFGTIVGGVSQKLSPGDVMFLPAGTPHQYTVEKGNHFYFLVVKMKKK